MSSRDSLKKNKVGEFASMHITFVVMVDVSQIRTKRAEIQNHYGLMNAISLLAFTNQLGKQMDTSSGKR